MKNQPEQLVSIATIFLFICYLLGFIILNAHLFLYSAAEFNLLNIRYLSSGILLLWSVSLIYGVEYGLIAGVYRLIYRKWIDVNCVKQKKLIKIILLWLLGSIITFILIPFVFPPDTYLCLNFSIELILAILICNSFVIGVIYTITLGNIFHKILFLPWLIILLGVVFGAYIYPKISPRMGGGALSRITVALKPSINLNLPPEVYLVSEGPDFLLITTDPNPHEPTESIKILKEGVSVIKYKPLITKPEQANQINQSVCLKNLKKRLGGI